MSIYSKDKEFQADKIGLEWYNKAGYSLDEVLPTFDVLMYSYLPFDEVEVLMITSLGMTTTFQKHTTLRMFMKLKQLMMKMILKVLIQI